MAQANKMTQRANKMSKTANKMIGCYDVASWNSNKSTSQVVMVSFISPTSGQWHLIAQDVSKLPNRYPNIRFLMVNVNELKSVAKEYNVNKVPTFVILKDGTEQKKIEAPKFEDLKKEIENYKT